MKYPLTTDQQHAADKVQKLLRLKNVTKLDSRELHDHGVRMEYESALDPDRLEEQLQLIIAFTIALTKSEAYATLAKHKASSEKLRYLTELMELVNERVEFYATKEAKQVGFKGAKS